MKLFLIGCTLLGCSLAIDAADSLSKPLAIKAQVDVSQNKKTAIHLKNYRNWYTLGWRPKSEPHGGTFRDLVVDFYVEMNSVAAVAPNLKVTLQQLSMVCTSAKNRYYYNSIFYQSTGNVNRSEKEFGVVSLFSKDANGGYGTEINIRTVPGSVILPAKYKAYSEDFKADVWTVAGAFLLRFPWHERELSDGGADCQGSTSIVLESEI